MNLNTIMKTTDIMDHFNKLDRSDLKIALASIIDVWHNENGKTSEEARQFTKELVKTQELCHEKFGFFDDDFDEEEEQE